ncbi:NAD-dependent malic enzyme [Edaphobacter modestus]|uniref:NAD-dependent malic enzyme n=1 Tax=Edaphobacter modestus TaxID=388466 RepID=A0A4Q7YE89_9BACT|nr:NAD-dependent malic enzyme [Edaphobacter modestus]RZU35288.1 NAD-dependent malic enzyme [Edaphobacter modestus]
MATTLPSTSASRSDIPTGMDLLNRQGLNKGTAFTEEERIKLGLLGLLPPQVETLDEQVVRSYEAFQKKDNDLERHIYLRALQDTNEVLFYRLLVDHIEEMTPLVYTPTVATAIEQFSHIYRRPRGLFIPYPLRDSIPQLLRNRPNKDVDVIVVTDGERILGIGDQGAGGLGISIGKLSLYTTIGGVRPERTLPIVLDVGTNNKERLNDPEYLGWRHERITGQEYFDFVDQFVQAVKQEFPETCLQWEDFATPHARPILQRYRDQLLTFNDDIQVTAVVVLGAILGAVNVTGKSLSEQQIVMLGAGGTGIGVADGLRAAMISEGLSDEEARSRFWIVDKDGLLHSGRNDLSAEQRVYTQPESNIAGWPRSSNGQIGLADVIGKLNATILIGFSTVGGAFSEPIVREMARKVERPIILPLSNPTSKSEATAEDLIRWTDGRALVASGSPFAPVTHNGRTITIAQCNNVHVFPAMGLALVASRARRVTDAMMQAAARALAANSPALKDPSASLLSPLKDSRRVARDIAFAVGIEAQKQGLAPKTTEDELRQRVLKAQWTPTYPKFSE